MSAATVELTRIDDAIDRGVRRLLELQRPEGMWVGELESNVTMTAQHLFWNHFLGLRTPDMDRRIANELMARMRDDGTWSIWYEGPADLSTSIEAYVALRMAGVDPGHARSTTSDARAAFRRAGSSRSASLPCSGGGRGSAWCDPARADPAPALGAVLESTTSRAGHGRRS